MPETNTAMNPSIGGSDGARQLASVLLHNSPAQVGGMVTTVIMVGQAFAQFDQGMALYAAFVFACLLAIYQVRLLQKATLQESFITVPIAAVILFALALGGNNSLALKTTNTDFNAQLDLVKEQLELRTRELENARQLNYELRQHVGLSLDTSSADEPVLTDQAQNIWNVIDLLISPANAQPTDLSTEKQQELKQALRAYRMKQQELEWEQKKLEEEQNQLTKKQSTKNPKIRWRKW